MKQLNRWLVLVVLVICFYAGSAVANTVIDYELGGGWTYEEDTPGTATISNNPSGGIDVNINVLTGEGGLDASRHDLPGFSIFDNGFIQLEYGSLSSAITGAAHSKLTFELEFIDSSNNKYDLSMSLRINSGSMNYLTEFSSDDLSFDFVYSMPVLTGASTEEGALGFYFHDIFGTPYFKDIDSNVTYLPDWDLSAITDTNTPNVDNDFDASTLLGGTVTGTVNLKKVVYGPGAPASPVPIPATAWLLGSGLLSLIRLSKCEASKA